MADEDPKEPKSLLVCRHVYSKAIQLTEQNFEEVFAWFAKEHGAESHNGKSIWLWSEEDDCHFEVTPGMWIVWSDYTEPFASFEEPTGYDEESFCREFSIERCKPHADVQLLETKLKLDTLKRQKAGMTLGQLEARLAQLPDDLVIKGMGTPNSYRGYYEDLAFAPTGEATVARLRDTCRMCNGNTFEGYKGGEFYMHDDTAVWIANYGTCHDGRRLLGVNDDGTLNLAAPEGL